MAATELAYSYSRRLFIRDLLTLVWYLIDTGSDVSCLPATEEEKKKDPIRLLYAANGTPIRVFGEKLVEFKLGLRREIRWVMLITDVETPIIGADFLEHFDLSPDLRRKCLRDNSTGLTSDTKGFTKMTPLPEIKTIVEESKWFKMIMKYPGLEKPTTNRLPTVQTNVKHVIETPGRAVTAKPRRLTPDKLKAAQMIFKKMEEDGECRRGNGAWSSPMHMVMKKDGSWRITGDYRALNAVTKPDKYPVPNINDFNVKMKNMKIFSKVDINKAFYQIPMNEGDIEKTAIITPFGLFEMLKMPNGLKNAAQTFQRFLDGLLRDLDFCYAYMDDICIFSETEEEHERHVDQLLERLYKGGLTINIAKCEFGKQELDFLGYRITPEGIKPIDAKVKALLDFPEPKIMHELRRFLGMLNFYRRCIPKAAHTLATLYEMIIGSKKNDKTPITFNEEQKLAFDEAKQKLANAALLAHPDEDLDIILATDASDFAIGATLYQIRGEVREPLAFFSRRLSKAECKYSTYDRELLGIFAGIKHFKHMLEGRVFSVYTDHKPITYAFGKPNDHASPRQIRQLDYIGQFTTDIRYIAGEDNEPADALSRISQISVATTLPYEEIALAQLKDKELKELMQDKKTTLKFEMKTIPDSDVLLCCDVSTQHTRPFLPKEFREMAMQSVHNLSHPGPRNTVKLMTSRFIWPKMKSEVFNWAKACTGCQLSKISRKTKTPLANFKPTQRFKHVHVDIVGPLPIAKGKRYLLTMVDRATRWPEAVPLNNISAEEVVDVLYSTWIARFGVPENITTDQGRQFESKLFYQLAKMLGAKKCTTTAYHPQSNGKVERWHRALKASLMAADVINWVDVLPTILLGLRSSIQTDSGFSAAQLALGEELRLPGDFFQKIEDFDAEQTIFNIRKIANKFVAQPAHHGSPPVFMSKTLKSADYVFVQVDTPRTGFQKPYSGPYKVLERFEKTVKIKVFENDRIVSWDRCKPAFQVNQNIQVPPNANLDANITLTSSVTPNESQEQPSTPPRSQPSVVTFENTLSTDVKSPSPKKSIKINEEKNQVVEFKENEAPSRISQKDTQNSQDIQFSQKYNSRLFYNLRQAGKMTRKNQSISRSAECTQEQVESENSSTEETSTRSNAEFTFGENFQVQKSTCTEQTGSTNKNTRVFPSTCVENTNSEDSCTQNASTSTCVRPKRKAVSPLHSPTRKRESKKEVARSSPVMTRSKTKIRNLPIAHSTRSKKASDR